MGKDNSELIEYLDKRFIKTDERFDKIDDKFIKVGNKLDKIEKGLSEKADKKDVQNLMNSIDRLAKAIETYHHEQVALSAKVDRLENWVDQIAKKIGMELKP